METLFHSLYHGIGLKATGLVVGLGLIATHIYAMLHADHAKAWLQKFPRNKGVGIALLAVALVWALLYVSYMHMGEFFVIRRPLQFLLPVAFVLVIKFVDEFLSVRALGALLLLAACPVLHAAFLQPPASRLLLPILAYVWIFFGLFWVGMPYLLRKQIDWITTGNGRWKGACFAGIGYGALLTACAIIFY